MSDTKDPLDLSVLETDYEIIGELSSPAGTRRFMATPKQPGGKRHDDESRLLITVVTAPPGDEGNALAHLAADAQLLAHTVHRRLIPIVEGRWIGTDAFAVVTQRTNDASLAEKLATGETFSPTRTAAILREVNGVIEWAREQKVVHRNITPDGIYLEPNTDRVRVIFSVAPILRTRHSEAADDARTIARLGTAMLTGSDEADVENVRTLFKARPDLPARLGEATAALLSEGGGDVPGYLALIGMSDPLAAGETEAARIRAEVLEEQRSEREKLADERAAFDAHMAEERSKFDAEMAAARAQLAAEREELVEAVMKERGDLVAKRAELEREVAEQRAEVERVALADREQIEALRAELLAAGQREVEMKRQAALEDINDTETVLDDSALATPSFMPLVAAPLQEIEFADDSPLLREEEIPPMTVETAGGAATTVKAARRGWIIPAVIAAAIVLALAITVGIQRASSTEVPAATTTAAVPAPASTPVPSSPPATPDSQVVALPTVDSASAVAARHADSVAAGLIIEHKARKIVREATTRRDTLAKHDTIDDSIFNFRRPAKMRADTTARRDTVRRPDTTTAPPSGR